MKKTILLFAAFIDFNSLSAQHFLPIPEAEDCGQPICIIPLSYTGEILWTAGDKWEKIADDVGGSLANSDCGGSDEPWNCVLGKWLADQLPCMYHPSTPQGSLCKDGDKPDEDKPDQSNPDQSQPDKPNPDNPTPQEPNPDAPPQSPPKPDEDTPQGEALYINPSTTPLGWSWGIKQSSLTKESFVQWVSKLKNGSLIAKCIIH